MFVIPAIDLKKGQCVRLQQGDFSKTTVYSNDPLQTARFFREKGAHRLHVVDLDGAESGKSENAQVIQSLVKETKLPIQLGGGIRSLNKIERWLKAGIDAVILGTLAIKQPGLVAQAIREFGPERIILALDAKAGWVMIEGWQRQSNYRAEELALKLKEHGLKRVLYTDVLRDGMFTGPNIKAIKSLAKKTRLKVMASGGISSKSDLKKLCKLQAFGVDSAVVGRAIYEKRIRLEEIFNVSETHHPMS